jgi:hypothetical protein
MWSAVSLVYELFGLIAKIEIRIIYTAYIVHVSWCAQYILCLFDKESLLQLAQATNEKIEIK